jgi:hypothetical protein
MFFELVVHIAAAGTSRLVEDIPMNNHNIPGTQIINEFKVATVTFVGGKIGLAKCFGEIIRFNSDTGYNIVADWCMFPMFGSQYADIPEEGDSIVVYTRPTDNGVGAVVWGTYKQYKTAVEAIKKRMDAEKNAPKPALATPQIPMSVPNVEAQVLKPVEVPPPVIVPIQPSAVQPDKKNQSGGRDRRKLARVIKFSAEAPLDTGSEKAAG